MTKNKIMKKHIIWWNGLPPEFQIDIEKINKKPN